jgi:integrase
VFSVSRWLGHASASFTMDTYGHLLAGQQRQAAEALDHLLAEA